MTNEQPTWGQGVRTLRGVRGMTQTQLAKAANVTQSAISELENGERKINDAARVRIARALGVPTIELFPYLEDAAS